MGTVVCIGGGIGVAPIYPIARKMKQVGNHVITIMGAKIKIFDLKDEMEKYLMKLLLLQMMALMV